MLLQSLEAENRLRRLQGSQLSKPSNISSGDPMDEFSASSFPPALVRGFGAWPTDTSNWLLTSVMMVSGVQVT